MQGIHAQGGNDGKHAKKKMKKGVNKNMTPQDKRRAENMARSYG